MEQQKELVNGRLQSPHNMNGAYSIFSRPTMMAEEVENADLQETIERHISSDPSLANSDIRNCTWDDVRAELEKAQIAAKRSAERGRMSLSRFWQGLGKRSEILIPGLDAIPDTTRVLRAGLTVIFRLARNSYNCEHKILDAFENIPNIVQAAESSSITLLREGKTKENERLSKHARDLQRTLVQAIPNLIEMLHPNTFLKRAISPFRGFNIDQLLETVYRQAETMRVYSESIRESILADTHDMARDITSMTHGTCKGIEELHRKVDEVLLGQKFLQQNFELVSGKNHLFQFLMESQRPYGSISSTDSGPETLVNESLSPVSSLGSDSITLNELLELLDLPHLALNSDEDHVLRHGRSVDDAALSTAALMVRSPQVQKLLRAREPGIVLVEGCGDRSQMPRVSPLSVVCATLAHTLRTRTDCATLLFFCGRHAASNDNLWGPQGLMRSILVQLILLLVEKNWISDFTRIHLPGTCEERMWKPLALDDVCQLFHTLMRHVPSTAEVFCLVDGISFFEREDWSFDYDMVMVTLEKIIADQNLDAMLKLLITTPTRSSRLSSLEPHQRVALRKDGSQTSFRSAFRMATW